MRRTITTLLFALIAFASISTLAAHSATAQPLIVDDGKTNAQIVIAEQPTRTMRLAAWELQKYVRKISGAELPIVDAPSDDVEVNIYVGKSAHTDKLGIGIENLKYGAYRIVSGDDWLVLIGDDTNFQPIEPYAATRSERGSEAIISQWDAVSDSLWEHPLGNAFKNWFKHVNREYDRPSDEKPLHLWAYDERGSFNAVCGFLRELGVRWYMPGELGEVVPTQTTIALPEIDRTVHPAFPFRDSNVRIGIHNRRLALWAMRLGARHTYGMGWAHGLNLVTSRAEMQRTHPEYYALYAGKRHTGHGHKSKQCLSTRGLLKQTIAFARTLFDHYNYEMVNVQPADGYTSLCQCQYCEGRGSPERAYRGQLSDYVWGFTVRVADEIAKTHPDKKISNLAYNLFLRTPNDIDKLPDNVGVALIGSRRPTHDQPEQREQIRELRRAWGKMTDYGLFNFENYPLTARGYWLPAFTAHTNARSINNIKGTFLGENIQPSAHRFMESAAFNSYQFYFTFRMYWGGKDQAIDPMLEEFYRLFYGPAASQMQAFFDYCEANWRDMRKDKAKVDKALALFDEARRQASEGSVYDQRLALMGEYLENLEARSEQIAKEQQRKNVPAMRMWRGAEGVKVDGHLDDSFWASVPTWAGNRLRELRTGRDPQFGTSFKVAWGRNAIYFAIRCEESPDSTVRIGTERDDDAAIWMGDAVEILLETEQNSYYQIAINPAGAIADLNRQGKQKIFRWESQAEVATHVGDDHWTAEVRIPVIESSNDPFHQVIGRRPLKDLSWYFNVCRQRVRESGTELSAFSPTGDRGFHVPSRFGKLYYK